MASMGLLVGWALGIWESGLVLACFQHSMDGWAAVTGVLLMPAFLYGIGGWVLGAILGLFAGGTPSPKRVRFWAAVWTLLFLGGAAFILRANLPRDPSRNLGWGVGGGVLSVAFFGMALRSFLGAGQEWPARARRAALLSLAFPVVFLVGLFLTSQGSGHLTARAPQGEARQGAPNIVLVNWDTVRADTLPLFGGAGLDTPNLDRLAEEGLLFQRFHAVAPITGPSHLSMLSGLYPPTHGARSNGEVPALSDIPRLPELCAEAGYATGGFISGYPLRKKFGFELGFQIFDDRPSETPTNLMLGAAFFSSSFARRVLPRSLDANGQFTPGEVTLERAAHWYRQTDRPAFLWIHFYDAHHPYDPPEPFRQSVLARASEGPRPIHAESEDEWVLQRGEIERLDHLLGELRVALEEKDPGLANTLIVLAADHGECFGEGGLVHSHHSSLYPATQHIVGLVRAPTAASGVRRGERSSAPASQVDLLPTICELAGLPIPEGVQGRSLVEFLRSDAPGDPERGIYMEAWQRQLGDERMYGWVQGRWRYMQSLEGEEFLYDDESEDPLRNVILEQPQIAAAMRQAMEQYYAALPKGEGRYDESATGALDELGYVDGEDEPVEME